MVGNARSDRPPRWPLYWRARSFVRWRLIELAQHRRIRFGDLDRHPPILVYQMGKVGSRSVEGTLRDAAIPNDVLHVHFLSPFPLATSLARHRKVRGRLPLHYHTSAALRWRLAHRPPRLLYVVTMVRDPVARVISGFFQVAPRFRPDVHDESGAIVPERALAAIRREVSEMGRAGDYTLDWFTNEFRPALRVDPLQHPFDAGRGYQILDYPGLRVLIMRTEDISRVFSSAVSELLGTSLDIPLDRRNTTGDGTLESPYRRVVETIRFPRRDLERIYSSRLATHFYTAEERTTLLERWASSDDLDD